MNNNTTAAKKWSPSLFIDKLKGLVTSRGIDVASGSIITRNEQGRITGTVSIDSLCDFGSPFQADRNFINLFESVPEVAFPILFIAERAALGEYQLKKYADDSVVFDNEQVNRFLSTPNPLTTFKEFVTSYFAYELITGNSYISASVLDSFSDEIWKWCDSYWVLPADMVDIESPPRVPIFTSAKKEEIIQSYRLSANGQFLDFPPSTILHTKDVNFRFDSDFLKGKSRLTSQMKPISNLIAVYEARNVIYVKRGGLGFLVNKKVDEMGSASMTPTERDNILSEYQRVYGLRGDKSPIGISMIDMGFIRTNLSIQELEPFEETLVDACQIAGAYGIPSVLIPRKDNSTFSNQENAEKAVYSSVIIPRAKEFAKNLTSFLGLEKSGLYIDVDFSNVAVLQKNFKEKQEAKKVTSEKCRQEFLSGIITLNDWRAQIGESKVDNPLYRKLMLEMSESELATIRNIYNPQQKGNVQ